MSLTLSEAKRGVNWTPVTNLAVSDQRLVQYINEAVSRLMPKGKWVGTYQHYQLCAFGSCFTWPRQFETIEAAWFCERPMMLRNEWFETLPHGYGRQSPRGPGCGELIDRGRGFCTFTDLTVPSKVRLYPTSSADVGKTVLLQGNDVNYQWITTNNGLTNGELVTLALPFVDAVTTFAMPGPIRVQKAVTRGAVRAFSYDATLPPPPASPGPLDTPMPPLAYWEPDETLPDYRRSMISGVKGSSCGGPSTSTCGVRLTVIAKLKFIPVVNDTDFILLDNLPAIKEMVVSVLKAERGLIQEAEAHEARAVRLLEEQLSSYEGHGVVQPFKVDSDIFAGGDNYVTPAWGSIWFGY